MHGTMKKMYITPLTETIEMQAASVIATSILSNRDLGYGGVDANGELDPAAKHRAAEDEMFEEDMAIMNQKNAWQEGMW